MHRLTFLQKEEPRRTILIAIPFIKYFFIHLNSSNSIEVHSYPCKRLTKELLQIIDVVLLPFV